MSFIKINKIDKTFFPGTIREQHALKMLVLKLKMVILLRFLEEMEQGNQPFLMP